MRYGAVALFNNASPANAIANTFLQATGDGPQIAFVPGTLSVLGAVADQPGAAGLAIDGGGNLFLADSKNDRILEILAEGGYTTVKTLTSTINNSTFGVALDGSGNLFFAAGYTGVVKELTAASGYTKVITLATGPLDVEKLTVDGNGNVFFCSSSGSVNELVAAEGYTTVHTVATGFNDPWGIAVDGNGNLFVSEYQDGVQVKEILAAGGYTTVLPIGPSLSAPMDVEVDGSGNVFVLTGGDGDLREILASSGYTSMLTLASATPFRVFALDSDGGVFLAKNARSFLRELDLVNPPTHNFATTAAGSTSSDSPRTLTAINNGNQTLHFSDVSYPVDFQERAGVPTDCTSSTDLSVGDTCTMTIHFSPLRTSATGLSTQLSEEVDLTDDNLNVTGATQSVAVTGTETFTPPALTTPTPGNPIGSSSATFTWTPGSAKFFKFWLGTTVGSNNIYGIGQTEKTSVSVSKLPSQTIYARLYYLLAETWKSLDYTYPGASNVPSLTSPAPGSTLSGSTVTFSWNPGSYTTFQFRLGTTLGSNNIYGSGGNLGTDGTFPRKFRQRNVQNTSSPCLASSTSFAGRPPLRGARGRLVVCSNSRTNSSLASGRPVCVHCRTAAISDSLSPAARYALQLETFHRSFHSSHLSHPPAAVTPQ
jgi:hypothetical protein